MRCLDRVEAAKPKKKRKAKKLGPLSFDVDDDFGDGASDAEDGEKKQKKKAKKIIKNPNVETDFLPDKDREQEEARERERLRAEWEAEQERIKSTWCGVWSVECGDVGVRATSHCGTNVYREIQMRTSP